MKPARIVFPKFDFAKDSVKTAVDLAKRGVGGFCGYGATVKEAKEFFAEVSAVSPYTHLLFCADIEEDLSEIIKDAPVLISNHTIGELNDSDLAYRKGLSLARQAKSIGIDWLLAPVVDLGKKSPSFCDNPVKATRLAGDFVAGLSNGGVLNCIKYFPGVSGIGKSLPEREDAEFMPYKSLFRRADALMVSDVVFPKLDKERPAMLSEFIVQGILKKRLNYKGCVACSPMFKSAFAEEPQTALHMLKCGVEMLLAPSEPLAVVDAVEKAFTDGNIEEEVIHAISNHELFISKISSAIEVFSTEEAFAQAEQLKI